MNKYLFIICLFILTSCVQNNEKYQDDIKNSNYNEKLPLSEQNEVFKDFHKNKNILNDDKTKKQQSNDDESNNEENEEQGIPENKNEDKITYGEIENEDSMIPFKVLDPKYDNTKDKNTSGYITKGQNGIKRKEVIKVYNNEKYSHTETVMGSKL